MVDSPNLKVAVTGATGLVGSALKTKLESSGSTVLEISRKAKPDERKPDDRWVNWSVREKAIEKEKLEGLDAVVHLAGENIFGRWTEEKKRAIRDSRVEGTRFLAETLAELERKPRVLICASAVGRYGDRGDEILTEESDPGSNFLARTSIEWEASAAPARGARIRVVQLRFGVILTKDGGALKMMLPPFKLGLGGPLGDGKQYMSWVSLDDVLSVIETAIRDETYAGPYNTVAQNPVTNRKFTKTLASVLNRPALIPVPRFAPKLLFGQMADEALFASTRAVPKRLVEQGYQFKHPELKQTLTEILS